MADSAPDDDPVAVSFTDPDRLLKLVMLVNLFGILSLGGFVVLTDDGPSVADQIGSSLSGENSIQRIAEERAAALRLGPILKMESLSVPLAGPTEYTLVLTLAVELEDEQALGDLERRTTRARFVMRGALASKRRDDVSGAKNMEQVRVELVRALNTIMPNGKVVQVWPQAWLVE